MPHIYLAIVEYTPYSHRVGERNEYALGIDYLAGSILKLHYSHIAKKTVGTDHQLFSGIILDHYSHRGGKKQAITWYHV